MPNIVKYNLSTSPNSIQSGNFNIGVNNTATDLSQFYNGICPINGGYTIYINKASNGPSIYAPKNDAELIQIVNNLGGNVLTVNESLNWLTSQSNITVLNTNYPSIVTSGLTLNLDAGFVSSYPRNGTTWTDLSGNVNNGTLINGPVYSGENSGCIVFDGVDDYISTPIQNLNRPCTFSMWVNLSSLTGYQTFFGQDTSQSILRGRFYFQKPGGTAEGFILNKVNFSIVLSDGGIVPVNSNNVIVTNIWYNYTAVLTTTTISLYENGILQNTVNDSNTFLTPNTTITLNAGYYNNSIVDYINGKSSSFLIYNRGLSNAEVLQNYYAGLQRFIPTNGLVLSLDAQNTNLYAVSPTTAYDISGNGYNGPLTNGIQYVADGNGSWLFDGVDDDIDFVGFADTFSFIQNTGIFTICAWVKVDDTTITQRAIMGNNRNSTTEKGFLLGKGTDGDRIRFVMTNGSANIFNQQVDNYFLDSNWVFVTIAGNGTSIIFYKNGSLFTTIGISGTLSTGSSNRSLVIGGLAGASTTFFWKGSISQTSIYNITLTATEISTIYNATKTRYGL